MQKMSYCSTVILLFITIMFTGCDGLSDGDGGTISQDPPGSPSPIPLEPDDHEDTIFGATLIQPGESITRGVIQPHYYTTPENDIDFFKMQLIENQWYGIQLSAIPSYYNYSITENNQHVVQLLDATGEVSIPSTNDWAWPEGVIAEGEGKVKEHRIMWQAPYTGDFYFTIQGENDNAVGAYAFKLASSQEAWSESSRVNRNYRSHVEIVEDGILRYLGPSVSSSDTDTLLGGVFDVDFLLKSIDPTEIFIRVFANEITFLDDEGIPNDEPENRVSHIHWGVPSADLSDGKDDVYWISEDEPVDVFNLDKNYQPGDGHPFIAEFDFEINMTSIPEELAHLIVGTDWYVDVHLTDNLDAYPIPIVSSKAQGGVRMFYSRLILNGLGNFPQDEKTGSLNELEVVYDDEYQVFYLRYGNYLDHAELVGATLHVHAGSFGETGELLIDLGAIPAPVERPTYEDYDTAVPGIENVIHHLSDDEALLLMDATYTTGWYLDLHTEPHFIDSPELRVNAQLGDNLEVGMQRSASNPGTRGLYTNRMNSLLEFPEGE